ncbi:hypothetical protein HY483_00100 [Candidatus Woesearchaeota archaeon]|nr:hypothetical protein [Candidatus Woesearchaeota archaeon]
MNGLYYTVGKPLLGFAASLDSPRVGSRWNCSDSDSLDSRSFVEVPSNVSQTFEYQLASEHMNIARFGNGADLVAKGFENLWYDHGMPSGDRAAEISTIYQRALGAVGVLEFSASLLNVRTIPQETFLRGLINRALHNVPGYNGGPIHQSAETDVFLEILDDASEWLDEWIDDNHYQKGAVV